MNNRASKGQLWCDSTLSWVWKEELQRPYLNQCYEKTGKKNGRTYFCPILFNVRCSPLIESLTLFYGRWFFVLRMSVRLVVEELEIYVFERSVTSHSEIFAACFKSSAQAVRASPSKPPLLHSLSPLFLSEGGVPYGCGLQLLSSGLLSMSDLFLVSIW